MADVFRKDAKATLARLLQSPEPLHPQIRKALSDALLDVDGALLKLVLVRRGVRGRPRSGLAALRKKLRLVQLIGSEEAAGTKALDRAAEKAGMPRRL